MERLDLIGAPSWMPPVKCYEGKKAQYERDINEMNWWGNCDLLLLLYELEFTVIKNIIIYTN